MGEYIKRTRVMTICERYSNHCFEQNDAHGQNIADGIFDDIVDLPTEDVVPVVRCKDCRFFDMSSRHCDHPMSTSIPISRSSTGYCSYGERK